MTKTFICMYSKNINTFVSLCSDSKDTVILTFDEDTLLDDYIERIRTHLCYERNVILTDEYGGSPYLASMIASANSDTIIISDVDESLYEKIIDFIKEGKDLSELVKPEQYFEAIHSQDDQQS